jgi:ligand-binding sensor domain-containing protein
MKLNILILLFFISIFCSCAGKDSTKSESKADSENTEIGDSVQKLGNQIWYIHQDKQNNYWFSSNGQGIYKYDGKSFLHFTKKDGLSSDTIRQILEDKEGNMYFSTMGGINKFDGKKFTLLNPIRSDEWKMEEDDLWFFILGKKGEHGPYRYDGKNLYSLEFPKHFLHEEFYERGINPFFSPYEIYSVYKDRKGVMWFGTSVFGLCRFDGKSIKWMYEENLTIAQNGGSFGIRSIFEDKEGSFWICNTLHRYIFDLEKTEKSDRLEYKKIDGIGNKVIFGGDDYVFYSHIIEDNTGNIWLTTWSQGVFKYDGKNITKYEVKDGSKDVNLVSMYKDKNGDLWLGTAENGVFKLNGEEFERFDSK